MHGRILALQTVLMVGTAPIGGPLLGLIADVFGPRAPLVVGGVASIAAAAWGFTAKRRSVDRMRRGCKMARDGSGDHPRRSHGEHPPPAGVGADRGSADRADPARLRPAWGVEDATVTVNGRGDKIHFFDNAQSRGDYGYHEVDPHGQPYAHVAAAASINAGDTWVSGTDSISASASHEALEMLGDPWANEWCFDGDAKLWSREGVRPGAGGRVQIRVGKSR